MMKFSELNVCMVATVGGSLIKNLQHALKEENVRAEIFNLETILAKLLNNRSIGTLEQEHLIESTAVFFNRGQRVLQSGKVHWQLGETPKPNKQASAELQSICQYLDQYFDQIESIQIHLLTTDTPLSKTAAQLVAQQLRLWYPKLLENEKDIEQKAIVDLKLTDLSEFTKKGLNNLLLEIYEIDKKLKGEIQLLLNITGGYKGTIPIMCLAAQLLGGQLLYSYEYQALPSPAQKDTPEDEHYTAGPLLEISTTNLHFFWDFLEACQPLMDRLRFQRNRESRKLSSEERKGIETLLVPMGICLAKEAGYRLTALGMILENLAFYKTPVSKRVLGYMMGFKVYEYFLEEPWENYHRVRQGYYFPVLSEEAPDAAFHFQDVDVLLGTPEEDWVWVEVKAYTQICFAYDDKKRQRYEKQLKNQMKAWKMQNLSPPNAYHLYFYRHTFHALDNDYLANNLSKINRYLQKAGISEFRVFYYTLDLKAGDWFSKRENPYVTNLAARKLTRNKIKYQEHQTSINKYDKYLLVQEFLLPIRES